MPVRIRSARLGEREEVPRHWEACRLRGGWVAAGWAGGVVAAAAGVAGMVVGQGSFLEPAGAVLAAAGATAVALVVRCRRWCTSVGREWVRTEVGPFVRRLPVGAVEEIRVRRATGVRRLFSAREVVVRLGGSGEVVAIASRRPGELRRELRAAASGEPAAAGSGVAHPGHPRA